MSNTNITQSNHTDNTKSNFFCYTLLYYMCSICALIVLFLKYPCFLKKNPQKPYNDVLYNWLDIQLLNESNKQATKPTKKPPPNVKNGDG